MTDSTLSPSPMIRVTLRLRQTRAGQWACYFMFKGKKREFVRSEMADAVMAAGDFLQAQAPIGLMRIIEQAAH